MSYNAMLDYYEKIAPHINEPLYMLLSFQCPVDIENERKSEAPVRTVGERLSPLMLIGGAAYSIICRFFITSLLN